MLSIFFLLVSPILGAVVCPMTSVLLWGIGKVVAFTVCSVFCYWDNVVTYRFLTAKLKTRNLPDPDVLKTCYILFAKALSCIDFNF